MTEQFAAQTDNTQGKTHQSDIQNDVSNAFLNELRDMDNNSNTFKNFAPEQSSKLEMESQMQDHAQKGSAGTSEKLEGANNQRNELSDKISDTSLKIQIGKGPVSDFERERAEKILSSDMSDLIPKEDRQTLKDLQGALINGNLDKFTETLQSLADNPEKLAQMVKALNDNLDKHEKFGGVDVVLDNNGNVFIYPEKGNTGLQIDPETGKATVRAIERQDDGSIVAKPGEVLNRTADELMSKLGDDATRSIAQKVLLRPSPIRPPFPGIIKPTDSAGSYKLDAPRDYQPGFPGTGGALPDSPRIELPKDAKPMPLPKLSIEDLQNIAPGLLNEKYGTVEKHNNH